MQHSAAQSLITVMTGAAATAEAEQLQDVMCQRMINTISTAACLAGGMGLIHGPARDWQSVGLLQPGRALNSVAPHHSLSLTRLPREATVMCDIMWQHAAIQAGRRHQSTTAQIQQNSHIENRVTQESYCSVPTIIIIINPCKPYLSASATAPHPLGRRKAD
jgi:hypothetical protein